MKMDFKKANKESSDLSIADFAKIQEVFNRNNWPISEDFGEKYFDRFCKMLANLNQEQCKLVLNLTDKFLWVQEKEYMSRFSDSFDLFINCFDFSNGNKICLCPALPEEDFGKSKSSVFLLYQLKVHLVAIQEKYNNYAITYIDSPSVVQKIGPDYTFCLIDDFIGTGETMENTIKYFISKGIVKERIAIVSLVGMKSGVTKLNNMGFNTYTSVSLDKGITSTGDKSMVQIMNAIEDTIGVTEDYRLGYKGSEALVRMMRTPNNTFPIYWLKNKKNQFAPFPR